MARGAGGVAVYGNRIYYAGGLRDSVAVNWFDAYDPVADTWTRLPDLPTAKDHFHAAVLGSRLYAISGRQVHGHLRADRERRLRLPHEDSG